MGDVMHRVSIHYYYPPAQLSTNSKVGLLFEYICCSMVKPATFF